MMDSDIELLELRRRSLALRYNAVRHYDACQRLAKLRKKFGDERRSNERWSALPDPLKLHWLRMKHASGENVSRQEIELVGKKRKERRITEEVY